MTSAAAGVVGINEAIMRAATPPFVDFTKASWNKGRLIGQKRPLKPRGLGDPGQTATGKAET
jgi:hypothetical protein